MEKNAAVNENSDSIGTEKEVRASVAFPQNAWYNDKIKMLIGLNQQIGKTHKLPSLSFRGRSPWESPAPQYRLSASQLTL